MSNFNLFKISNVIEASLVTSIIIYGLSRDGNLSRTPISLQVILAVIPLVSVCNCIINLYLIRLNKENNFLQKKAKIFFWISYSLFIVIMLFFCMVMVQGLITMYQLRGRYSRLTSGTGIMSFIVLLISLTSIYIALRQPFFYYIARKNYRQANDIKINSIGSES
jgi:hypothetical protein